MQHWYSTEITETASRKQIDPMNRAALHIHEEVATSLAEGRPVVALETNVLTHGLPLPQSLETSLGMEAVIRAAGATPATVAILRGRLTIGVSAAEQERLAKAPAGSVQKCSRRDLAPVIARGGDGATTVAATMVAAHAAGITVFATGGIGGVHRGEPFDISADLTELGRTPVAVVCSGAKSILDLPNTLEVLETNGVPVLGYQTDSLPAFFQRDSGLRVDSRLNDIDEAARVIHAHRQLGAQNGLLITVPVPEEDALGAADAEQAIARASREAAERGIRGKKLTPYVLTRVGELTSDGSLRANISLLRNNARIGAAIAVALSKMGAD